MRSRITTKRRNAILSLPRPMMLSLFLAFLLLDLLFMTGAGNVGFPVPLIAFYCSVAAVAAACDCCITLNSFTTIHNSVNVALKER